MDEFKIINNYLYPLSKNNQSSKKLNDDVFFDKKKNIVISIDTYNEGIHFINFKFPDLVIKKIIRSSISDLICKGVKPIYYFLSFSGYKNSLTHNNLKKIKKSLSKEQKKYKIKLSGGDTTSSEVLSFTVASLGFSKKIIERNKTKLGDDIYITGNIGDSYIGLKILKNKIKNLNKKNQKYFINKYFQPIIPYGFTEILQKYANSSIDISDGLIDDLLKLINKQNYHFKIFTDKIPVSKNFDYYIKENNLKKESYLFNGDDYQVMFTAQKKNRSKILKKSRLLNQKLTIIGEITGKTSANLLVNKNKILKIRKFKGYSHKF